MRRSEYSFAPVVGRSKLVHALTRDIFTRPICGTPANLRLFESFLLIGVDGPDPLVPDNLCKKCARIIKAEEL